MRKLLWIILALMVVAVSAPNAHADTFTYSYTDSVDEISWTTAPLSGVTMETTVPAVDLTATSNTGNFAGCVTTLVVLDAGGIGNTQTNFSSCQFPFVIAFDGFAATDYTTPGTYHGGQGTLVVAAAVAAPEPSSVALMLLGVGLVFVLRKRTGAALSRAS
jgi:hypothetical protein